jgi:ABC-2 type transport system ATP-binding protein
VPDVYTPPMDLKNILSVKNLAYVRHSQRIIQNLNLNVGIGECIVLTGANGTGKSTTLNILAGLIRPTSGHAFIQGQNIHNHFYSLLCKKQLGFLPDKPPLYHELTIKEHLNLIAKLRLISKQEREAMIEYTLERLNIKQYQHRLIGTLSKGQQQRVGIAQTLLHKPTVLLLDEPTQGLDPDQIDSFLQWLNEYKQQAAILLSSHHFTEVEFICNRRLQFTRQGITEHDIQHCTA